MRRLYHIAAILLLALGLQACQLPERTLSPPAQLPPLRPASNRGALDNPCALLAAAEVAPVLGEKIEEPVNEQELGNTGCSYTPAVLVAANALSVEVSPAPTPATFDRRKAFFVAQGGTPVAGFGGEAYAKGGAILVAHDRLIFYLVLLRDDWDERRRFAAAKDLTLKALARLP